MLPAARSWRTVEFVDRGVSDVPLASSRAESSSSSSARRGQAAGCIRPITPRSHGVACGPGRGARSLQSAITAPHSVQSKVRATVCENTCDMATQKEFRCRAPGMLDGIEWDTWGIPVSAR